MKNRKILIILTLLLLTQLLGACHRKVHYSNEVENRTKTYGRVYHGNAVYHWKTTFDLSAQDSVFLAEHEVGRIYVKFFDVEVENGQAVPAGDVCFKGAVPEGVEIVPTVYITVDALRQLKTEQLAEKIYKRVCAMMKGNHIEGVREVQIDCDWTETTRDLYFGLCQHMHDQLSMNGLLLSSTIRLHQLTQPVPPVDCGVLMMYNTGSVVSPQTDNSILTYEVAHKYLRRVNGYDLPLDVAYPMFSWSVVFSEDKFRKLSNIAPGDNCLRQKDSTHYEVVRDSKKYGLSKGERIRYEAVSSEEVLRVKALVENALPDSNRSIILYHLGSNTYQKYSDNEINAFYE